MQSPLLQVFTFCTMKLNPIGAMTSALCGSTYGVSTGLLSGAEMPFVSSLFSSASMQAFVGGILLWFGARMGGGCTSG